MFGDVNTGKSRKQEWCDCEKVGEKNHLRPEELQKTLAISHFINWIFIKVSRDLDTILP